ncbi:mechanosensitive ion channel family protein [uncultured Methanoregula sp.]|uniref:mechanosensitive ion channel family protein n=1 Tax=uncultured Methanoregula sp. TaxID=1005933 RepID=UPI002AAC2354|nr:mechanosensitive ion channel family protein [uncultured Methanoregula sp.]
MDSPIIDILLFIAAGIIAAILVHLLFTFLIKKAEQTETKMDDLIVHSLGAPLVMLAFFVPLYYAIQKAITVYPQYAWIADSNVLFAGYILVGTWIIATFVDKILLTYGTALAEQTETDLDDRIIGILQKIAKYLIWFTGILYIFTLFNINITPLIAGAGIVGIAIALAAQDLFSNFFGGAVIITDQPFKVGDRVLINDILGDIIHIGPRSTRIITPDSDIVTIPNNKITTSVVRNFSLPSPQIRIQVLVSVAYGTDITVVKSVLMHIAKDTQTEMHELVAGEPEPTVYVTKMDKSAMTFEVTVYAREFTHNSIIRDHINTKIIEEFRKESIIIS